MRAHGGGRACGSGAAVLTTEKDAVRLEAHPLGGLPVAVVPLIATHRPAVVRRLAARAASEAAAMKHRLELAAP